MSRVTRLTVNGKAIALDVEGERSLLSVLRDDLGLTGAKYGCGEGHCGACTVLIDDAPLKACQVLMKNVGSRPVVTIEGLEAEGKLHPVQEAFLRHEAFQCGYCTSGMIMAAAGLLKKSRNPSEAEIKRFMAENVCRCGTYQRIVAAIRDLAR